MTGWTSERQGEYLRNALDLLDGLPRLIEHGRPDQVQLELGRIRRTLVVVLDSLDLPAPAPAMTAHLCDED